MYFLWLCILLRVTLISGNRFDPHVFPQRGPFFEGWYIRLIDSDNGNSIGLLFGQVLPDVSKSVNNYPPVLCSILVRSCSVTGCKLFSHDATFNSSDVKVRVKGKPVDKNPDISSPANFTWLAKNSVSFVFFRSNVSSSSFRVKFGNVSLDGELSSPIPWGPDGEGPEGWVDKFPLPLHWFVYSLRSSIVSYKFKKGREIVFEGRHGTAHMEKNWGKSFPKAWIWSEGISPNNVTYVVSGGHVQVGPIPITAHLLGYRNPLKNISVDFHPYDSYISAKYDGCRGFINITARGPLHSVELYVTAELSSFSQCLYGPESQGFRPVCKETYDASATIYVYRLNILIDKQFLSSVALEFGGENVCGGCTSLKK
ncbi:uncharacterized protein LOC133205288 [Saccostrea echinata]|uniref:uncharacterized protein LOC133205288 n=1 Tax=Saccostrea echinata TaxID=191078 RepID=UPI002A7F1821|nr:uncharacterized protein LOC133205288 [Saccostrea echinata]